MAGRHRYEDVNAWLAEDGRAFGFVKPPTIERILSGEIKFVRRDEATNMLMEVFKAENPSHFVYTRIRAGQLKAVRLRLHSWLIALQSVEWLIREHARPEGFSLQDVRQICGFGVSPIAGKLKVTNTLWRLRSLDQIELFNEDIGDRIRVRRRGFVALVERSLCKADPPISAEDWIDDRLNSPKPLLSAAEAGAQLGFTEPYVISLIRKGEIQAIRSPGGRKFYVSPESVDAYQAGMYPVTRETIGRVFGVRRRAIATWHRDGSLVCVLHGRECRFYHWCLVAYVAKWASNGTPAIRWVHDALSDKGGQILTHKSVDRKLLTGGQLTRAVVAGRIWSVLAPNGRRVYMATTVFKEAARLRKSGK